MHTLLRVRRLTVAVLLGSAVVTVGASSVLAAKKPQYDLFYNYYEGGGQNGRGGVPVAMYPSPLPVPPNVGQTYITYQPFLPQEYLYQHQRTYVRHGNVTHVSWKSRPLMGIVIERPFWSIP